MDMDGALLLDLIGDYQKNNELTYEAFDQVFGKLLSRKEQYLAAEELEKLGITLVDELSEQPEEMLPEKKEAKGQPEKPAPMPLVVHDHTAQTNAMLCRLIQQGDRQACQDLCTKNRPLVLKFAFQYQKMVKYLDEFDLEQLGFMGLIKAAKRFDLSRDNEFSTYAVPWIQQSITRGISDTDLPIRLPVHMIERIRKINKIENRLIGEGVEKLSDRIPLIAQECELPDTEVEKALTWRNQFTYITSLDYPIGEEQDTPLEALIADTETPSPENLVCNQLIHEKFEELLQGLTLRECEILKLRIGWDDDRGHTLDEIGKMYGVTRERIRQIEKKAIGRLKRKTEWKEILEF
jgi:RNA polymerase primary sigma factor